MLQVISENNIITICNLSCDEKAVLKKNLDYFGKYFNHEDRIGDGHIF
jgi:hypothetical protein